MTSFMARTCPSLSRPYRPDEAAIRSSSSSAGVQRAQFLLTVTASLIKPEHGGATGGLGTQDPAGPEL